MIFTIGQRWISNTESQLGLGIISELNGRQVHIFFPAAEEERIYARDNPPLSRIMFQEGDQISTSKLSNLTITAVKEQKGLLSYATQDEHGNELEVKEVELNGFIKLSTPEQRLFSGLLDKHNAFKLRIDTLNHLGRLQQSEAKGLIGSRTSHLPHQIYIAHEVAQRHAPRVMLADEVGLGKTIEAGMILHHQLHTGRASRILIVVPNALIHQWFVEMRRRFNLHFSIFDQELMDESLYPENLFDTQQLILCSLAFLLDNEKALDQASSTHWDLLIVDEAHHLHWSEEKVSPEYSCVESLALRSKGLLLLTATPEQAGMKSHFSRLRLLDPARFHDFKAFQIEEEQYQEINQLVQLVIAFKESTQSDELTYELKERLKPYFAKKMPVTVQELIQDLLDRHGTGRVLFRNTRASIGGFPERKLHSYPLARPSIYATLIDGKNSLYPELLVEDDLWIQDDPRVSWLAAKLKEISPEKALVICAKATTAMRLEQHLKKKLGIRTAAFHEGLTIIERDRSAAYFAEPRQGAEALICSEIGSEGRNFQFSHHLILFDLPLNPDLLEQRIGRLDRIGQLQTIQIHVPYLLDTAQEVLFCWYHEGLHSFETSCSIGFSVYEAFQNQLLPLLEASIHEMDEKKLTQLIAKTNAYTKDLNAALKEGRDRLLELNSFNLPKAQELIASIEDEENSSELEHYMSCVFQEYAVEQEHHSDYTEILRPTTQMQVSHFPGLNEEETTVTYSRKKALIRDDMQFLSWEHPMVSETMEMILDSELGNANLTTISVPGITPGTLFLETFFTINCAAPKALQLDQFLPIRIIRVFMDSSGKNLTKVMDYTQLNPLCQPIKRHLSSAIISQVREDLERILQRCNQTAQEQMVADLLAAKLKMKGILGQEMDRLEYLRQINASIRQEEIDFFKNQIKDCEHYLDHAALKLQAIRVVINK